MAEARPSSRLSFVDLARGLAVLLMLQTHVYDAWLRPELRGTWFFQQSQFLGGLPGADFLFLLGVGSSLANETSRGRGGSTKQVVATGMRRGAWLLSVAFLFRIIMYLASDRPEIEAIFKVDILNCLGVSLALMTCVEIAGSRTLRIMAALAGGAFFAIGASFVWDGDLVTGLPNRIAGYFSGRVFNSSFPLFPWTAFAFAGHGVGTLIAAARGPRLNLRIIQLTLGALAAIPLALALDRAATLGPHYDFWWTSPNLVSPSPVRVSSTRTGVIATKEDEVGVFAALPI